MGKVPFTSTVKQLCTVFLSKVECSCSTVLGKNVSLSRSKGSLIQRNGRVSVSSPNGK